MCVKKGIRLIAAVIQGNFFKKLGNPTRNKNAFLIQKNLLIGSFNPIIKVAFTTLPNYLSSSK